MLTPQFKISPRQTHKKNDTSDSAAQGIDDQRCCGHCGFFEIMNSAEVAQNGKRPMSPFFSFKGNLWMLMSP